MNRRDAVLALVALAAAPLVSHAQQQGRIWRVGFLAPRRRPDSIDADFLGAFPRGMRELGYVEGKNLVIEWRFANGEFEPLSDLAAELVRLKVDVLVSGSSQAISVIGGRCRCKEMHQNFGMAAGRGRCRSTALRAAGRRPPAHGQGIHSWFRRQSTSGWAHIKDR